MTERESAASHNPEPPRSWGREQIAAFLLEHQAKVRAIARRKLSAPSRSVFDSQDVLSSVMRRMDNLAVQGRLLPHSEAELWALITTITKNTAVSRTRLIERARNLVTEDGVYAYELLKRLSLYATDEEAELLVVRMMASLKDSTDQKILGLLLRGATHRVIGELVSLNEDAVRKRWQRVRDELSARFATGEFGA